MYSVVYRNSKNNLDRKNGFPTIKAAKEWLGNRKDIKPCSLLLSFDETIQCSRVIERYGE